MVRQRREIGSVLSNKPVQELLESLATKLPEEDESIGLAESTLEPVKDGWLGSIVELLLENSCPDPGTSKNGDDGQEGDSGSCLDVDRLSVQQSRNKERANDSGKVGEEGRKGARSNGEVGCQPCAHKAVVEVADEERRDEKKHAPCAKQRENCLELGGPGWLLLHDDERLVFSLDLFGGAEEERDWEAETHNHDKDDVCCRADGAFGGGLGVETEVDGASDDGACCFGRLPDG